MVYVRWVWSWGVPLVVSAVPGIRQEPAHHHCRMVTPSFPHSPYLWPRLHTLSAGRSKRQILYTSIIQYMADALYIRLLVNLKRPVSTAMHVGPKVTGWPTNLCEEAVVGPDYRSSLLDGEESRSEGEVQVRVGHQSSTRQRGWPADARPTYHSHTPCHKYECIFSFYLLVLYFYSVLSIYLSAYILRKVRTEAKQGASSVFLMFCVLKVPNHIQ